MHPEILTPVMPGYYGIKDSHRSSRLVMEPDSAVNAFQDRWILPAQLPGLINGDTAMGNCVTSKYFQGFKVDQRTRMERALDILPVIGADFEKTFGRPGLEFFEKILWPDANDVDVAIIGMGPDVGTAAAVAASESDKLNVSIGVLGARLLTPFPYAAYATLLAKAKIVLILNQAHHYGPGHLGLDIAQACYALEPRPSIVNCFAGMGGASVSDETWRQMIRHACRSAADGERMERPTVLHEGTVLWPS
jgi:pyruvate/2-oxoacid:ferredoxin oxidoreductase alpha subunit